MGSIRGAGVSVCLIFLKVVKKDKRSKRTRAVLRGPKDRMNIGMLHSGSKARDKGDSRNHGWQDACDYVVVWALAPATT